MHTELAGEHHGSDRRRARADHLAEGSPGRPRTDQGHATEGRARRRPDHPSQERRRRDLAPARSLQAAARSDHGRRDARAPRARARRPGRSLSGKTWAMIAIDTSVLIDLLGGDSGAEASESSLRQALSAGPVVVCEVVVSEVVAGLGFGAELLDVLEEAGIRYSATDARAAVRAGKMQRRYKQRLK